jgi:hypothetical protein
LPAFRLEAELQGELDVERLAKTDTGSSGPVTGIRDQTEGTAGRIDGRIGEVVEVE